MTKRNSGDRSNSKSKAHGNDDFGFPRMNRGLDKRRSSRTKEKQALRKEY